MLFEGGAPIIMDRIDTHVFTSYALTWRWKSAGHLTPLAVAKAQRFWPTGDGKSVRSLI